MAPSSSSSSTGPHQIFLCHSSNQKGFVRDLYDSLSDFGYSVFFDIKHHSLPLAENFPAHIKEATQSCKLAIVVLSKQFLTSPWPMRELCAFADRRRSLPESSSNVATYPPEVAILPLFFKVSPEDLKDEEKLQAWRDKWKEWDQIANSVPPSSSQANKKARMSCSASECEAAVKLLRSLNGIQRCSKREEGEASYVDRVIEGVGEIMPAFSSLRSPFKDPYEFHVGKDRLCQLYELFPRSRFKEKKKFMALDNIGASNYESYKNMVTNILACGRGLSPRGHSTGSTSKAHHRILTPGSRIIITARSATILDNLCKDLEKNSVFGRAGLDCRYASTQIPCLTDDEAMALISHHYLGHSKHRPQFMTRYILPKPTFPSSSFEYIPQVLQLMGVLLRKNIGAHDDEEMPGSLLRDICEMVDATKVNSAQTILGKIYDGLRKDLQALFLDIALFIVPSRTYIGDEEDICILSKLQGSKSKQAVRLKITELREHCFLDYDDELGVHDIFREFARTLPESSESYVNMIVNSAEDASFLRFPKARTIHLHVDTRFWSESEDEMQVEVGPPNKALVVKSINGTHKASKARLHLCGNPSSLVHLLLENVELIAKQSTTNVSSDHKQLIRQPRHQPHARWLTNLTVLQLVNVGIPFSMDGIYWDQLEVLQMDEIRDIKSLTIGNNAPKLKTLIIGGEVSITKSYHMKMKCEVWNSGSQLILTPHECPQLETMIVTESNMFDEMSVVGPLPSGLLNLQLEVFHHVPSSITDGNDMIVSFTKDLELLESLYLVDCMGLERLLRAIDRSINCMPQLRRLEISSCSGVKQICISPRGLPELETFILRDCESLEHVSIWHWNLLHFQVIKYPKLMNLSISVINESQQSWAECCSGEQPLNPEDDLDVLNIYLKGLTSLRYIDGLQYLPLLEVFWLDELPCLMGISSPTALTKCWFREDQITNGRPEQLYSLSQCTKLYFKLDESEEDVNVYPMEGNSQHWPKQQNVFELCNPWAVNYVRVIDFETLTTLESIDGLHYLPCLEHLILKHLPQLTHISGTEWPTKLRRIWICGCPMLKEIPRWDWTRGYSRATLILQDCGAMEAFPVDDNCQTLLSKKNDIDLVILECKFGGMEDLERWMQNSKFRSPLFIAALLGLLWKIVVKGKFDALQVLFNYFCRHEVNDPPRIKLEDVLHPSIELATKLTQYCLLFTQFSPRRHDSFWKEWEQYCVRLAFASSSLEHRSWQEIETIRRTYCARFLYFDEWVSHHYSRVDNAHFTMLHMISQV